MSKALAVKGARDLSRNPNGTFVKTYTKEKADQIAEAVGDGLPLKHAGALVDVAYPTLEGWLRQGEEDPTSEYAYLSVNVNRKRAEFVRDAMLKIREAGDKPSNWAALMTLLERTDSEHFARPQDKRDTSVTVNVAMGFWEKAVHEIDASKVVEADYTGG